MMKKTLTVSLSQRKMEDLLEKQKEVNDQLQMAEDDVAQVNDVLAMLHDSKEVRTNRHTHSCVSCHTPAVSTPLFMTKGVFKGTVHPSSCLI